MLKASRRLKERLSDEDYINFKIQLKTARLQFLDSALVVQELEESGYTIKHRSLEIMPGTIKGYDLIRYDPIWLQYTAPSVESELASEVQGEALRDLVDEKNLNEHTPMPRNTLVIVAGKNTGLC